MKSKVDRKQGSNLNSFASESTADQLAKFAAQDNRPKTSNSKNTKSKYKI